MKPIKRQLRTRKHYFNLIEVALAMGVIGITFGTLMNVIPLAAMTSQKTMAENCSSMVASSLKTMLDHDYLAAESLEKFVDTSKLVYKGSLSFTTSKDALKGNYPAPKLEEKDILSLAKLVEDLNGDPFIGDSGDALFNTKAMSIYYIDKGLLAVRIGTDPDLPDFSAYIRIWAMPIAKNEGSYAPIIYRAKKTETPKKAQEKNMYTNLFLDETGDKGDQIIPPEEMLTIAVEIIYPMKAISDKAEAPEGSIRPDSSVSDIDWSLRYAQIKSFSFKYTMKEPN